MKVKSETDCMSLRPSSHSQRFTVLINFDCQNLCSVLGFAFCVWIVDSAKCTLSFPLNFDHENDI